MLLRSRAPSLDPAAHVGAEGYDHIAPGAIAVLSWLIAARVDFVLVGAVARAARGEREASGPVDIVPAPYGRNLDRLSDALGAARAQARHGSLTAGACTPQTLLRPQGFELRLGELELDIHGRPAGAPSYQELLYEAVRFTLADAVSVEVAALEDIEFYEHVRRTGVSPQIRVTRL